MKYGMLKFSNYMQNIGDYVQMEGIRQAYKRMKIPKEEIVEIEAYHLNDYIGEYVVLPMACAINSTINRKILPLSPKIIPVFVGVFTGDEKIAQEIAKYSCYGPIGCRDLYTMQLMRAQGVEAYMSGCMSIGYERRKSEPTDGKVYLYDPPEDLVTYIIENNIFKEGYIEIPAPYRKMVKPGYCLENELYGKKLYKDIMKEIKENAKLVVTRRLHVALSCIAMGVPVVLAHQCDTGLVEECRFSGLDRIIKVYKPEEFDSIDWNPKVPDIEWLKEKAISYVMKRLTTTMNKYKDLCELSEYYEGTENQIYYSGMKASYISEVQKAQWIKEAWKTERSIFEMITKKNFEDMTLIFYGAGDKCRWAIKRYHNYLKRVKQFYVVDSDVNKQQKNVNDIWDNSSWDFNTIQNYVVQGPDIIKNIKREDLVVVVTSEKYYQGAGARIGNYLMKEFNLQEGKELFFLDKLNNSMDLHLSDTSVPNYFLHGF